MMVEMPVTIPPATAVKVKIWWHDPDASFKCIGIRARLKGSRTPMIEFL
jgi:hypothetical protein